MRRKRPSDQLELVLPPVRAAESPAIRLIRALRHRLSSEAVTAFLFWAVLNLLAGIGIVAVLFVMLGNATFTGVMIEASNLAAHYGSAPPIAQAKFRTFVWIGVAIAFGALCAGRWRSLRPTAPPLASSHHSPADHTARS